MPVSLARRIRRIGLILSTKDEKGNRVHNHDPELSPEGAAEIALGLKTQALEDRKAAKAKQKSSHASHKARIKAKTKSKNTPAPLTPSTPAKGAK